MAASCIILKGGREEAGPSGKNPRWPVKSHTSQSCLFVFLKKHSFHILKNLGREGFTKKELCNMQRHLCVDSTVLSPKGGSEVSVYHLYPLYAYSPNNCIFSRTIFLHWLHGSHLLVIYFGVPMRNIVGEMMVLFCYMALLFYFYCLLIIY